MSGDDLLANLCTICHVNPLKYTCPRCGIHTCSLPCVKKHKQWAQCSGIRNPAEYRKRSELESSSSIDKDFNFIASVERSLEQAESITAACGSKLLTTNRPRPNEQRPKVDIEIEERHVNVVRAPKGLSRQKQNKTHWSSQHKCIMWTIEWICQDGQKVVGQGLELRRVGEAFVKAAGKKNILRKRQRTHHSSDMVPMPSVKKAQLHSPKLAADAEPQANTEPVQEKRIHTSQETAAERESQQENGEATKAHLAGDSVLDANDVLTGLYFYLHRPNTIAQLTCLIPLEVERTIREALLDQTVLEFPTIYVRRESPSQLSSPFIQEDDYLALYGGNHLINSNNSIKEGEIDDSTTLSLSTSLNEAAVAEVLAKDLAA